MKNTFLKKHSPAALIPALLALSLSACSAGAGSAAGAKTANEEPFNSASVRTEAGGYDTPEKAVAAYLDGLKNTDITQMIETFAVESYVENYDFQAQLERLKAYTPMKDIKFPASTPLSRALNIENRRNSVSDSITRQYLTLCCPDLDQIQIISVEDAAAAADFTEALEQQVKSFKPESIKLLGFIPPEELSEHYSVETNQKNMSTLADIYGAEKLESRAAVFELSGKPYLMCLDAVCYQGRWHILQLNGNIGILFGISNQFEGTVPLSEADLDWKGMIVTEK